MRMGILFHRDEYPHSGRASVTERYDIDLILEQIVSPPVAVSRRTGGVNSRPRIEVLINAENPSPSALAGKISTTHPPGGWACVSIQRRIRATLSAITIASVGK